MQERHVDADEDKLTRLPLLWCFPLLSHLCMWETPCCELQLWKQAFAKFAQLCGTSLAEADIIFHGGIKAACEKKDGLHWCCSC